MNDQTTVLLALVAAVVGLSAGYAQAFGAYQTIIVQWVIDAARAESRYRGLINLGVGLVFAAAVSAIAAWQTGSPGLLVIGLVAGVLASVKAASVHDSAPKLGTISELVPGYELTNEATTLTENQMRQFSPQTAPRPLLE